MQNNQKQAYLDISFESVEHRLVRVFSADKCSLLVVKFSSFKTKGKVFVYKPQLRGSQISISEDFSIGTHNLRRILTEFGKESNEPF